MLKRSRGFTLIEVTIVLAILMAIAGIAFFGRGENRSRTEFDVAMEELRTQMFKVKNEANTTVLSGTGDNQTTHFFGKLVQFTPNSNEIVVKTLLRQCTSLDPKTRECLNPLPALVDASTLNPAESYTIQLPSGVKYDNSAGSVPGSRAFLFSRNAANGQLEHYVLPDGVSLLDPSLYSAPNSTQQRYYFSYPGSPNITGDLFIATGTVRVERQ